MPTAFKFTEAQLVDIQALFGAAKTKGDDAVGAYTPIYEYVYRTVTGATSDYLNDLDVAVIAATTIADEKTRKSIFWLVGGSAVNLGQGLFSTVIRLYNKRQGALRGFSFSDTQIQQASNAVGRNFTEQILGIVENNALNKGYLPTVEEIGNNDLLGVRDILYPGNGALGDELYLNQAWPGILMLGKLGENYAPRLLQLKKDDLIQFDTLGDFKNCLFAWDAFKYAFDNTQVTDLNVAKDLAAAYGITHLTDFPGVFANFNNANWWFNLLLQNQD